MSVVLQYVIAVSSVLTASGVIFIAKEAHQTHQTVYDNEERSLTNREVLQREGLVRLEEQLEDTRENT